MTVYRDYESADAFTAGVVGLPGARTFFLQIGDNSEVLSIKCEKEQIAALAAFIRKTLDDAPSVSTKLTREPQFVEPDDAIFALGSVGLAYDRRDNHLVLQFEELSPASDDDSETDAGRVRLRLSTVQALMFCQQAERLVRAG